MNKQLLVGMPSTGKTTFLAALWHVVESGELSGSLQLVEYDADTEYLNAIRERWVSCEPVGRTTGSSVRRARFKLKPPGVDTTMEAWLPDMSGETFREQWLERRWDFAFEEAARGATGILLFVHPEKVEEPKTIQRVEAGSSFAVPAGSSKEGFFEEEEESRGEVAWDPDMAPTQAKLVDLLQFLARGLAAPPRLGLAVVISAWDVVQKHQSAIGAGRKAPKRWLRDRMPLLAQYLKANQELFESRIYGISAQGGDLETDKDELQATAKPSTKVSVCHGEQEAHHDITAPLKWLMRFEDGQ